MRGRRSGLDGRDLPELRQLNGSEFDRIAGELRVSPADLNELVHQGPHAADELPKLLGLLGIDQAALARSQPLVMRDMERVCALCRHKRQCDRDLASGSSAEHFEEYCLNAPALGLPGREASKYRKTTPCKEGVDGSRRVASEPCRYFYTFLKHRARGNAGCSMRSPSGAVFCATSRVSVSGDAGIEIRAARNWIATTLAVDHVSRAPRS
jgi:hypothetical protein